MFQKYILCIMKISNRIDYWKLSLLETQPSYYSSVTAEYYTIIIYNNMFTIQVSLTTEYYMMVTGDRWHMICETRHVTHEMWNFLSLIFFGIGATIRTYQEI